MSWYAIVYYLCPHKTTAEVHAPGLYLPGPPQQEDRLREGDSYNMIYYTLIHYDIIYDAIL